MNNNTDELDTNEFDTDEFDTDEFDSIEGIAIIGMAVRFPGAKNIAQFWQNLINGIESISTFSDEEILASGVDPTLLNDPNYVKAGAVLEDVDLFDAAFFGFTPREAQITDPQHRMFLECAWQALEDAGYIGETYPGAIGLFAGANMNTYLLNNIYSNPKLVQSLGHYQISLGNSDAFLCTRTSYKLNLTGPSVTVQTACSTTLVATSLACQSLLNYQSDLALAGGVTAWSPQKTGYLYQEGGVTSPDGHCRAFDANGKGTVMGSGVGVVVLKRLEDALEDGDHIYAIIRGSAINNDGSTKVGYTAPSIEGQAEAIMMAQAMAEIEPETITYIETHGTGTPLGDPIEIAALTKAFATATTKKEFCAIGSVKTNFGHLDTAAGIAGLIKTALALKHKQIPPSLHFKTPNPQIDFKNSPFYVNDRLQKWETDSHPRRAGVSSFGIGGTNVHAVLEEAPETEKSQSVRPIYPLLISAQTEIALSEATTRLAQHLKQHPHIPLADVAYTLALGRKAFNHRRVVLCQTSIQASEILETLDPKQTFTTQLTLSNRPVVFMFSGQGAQYINMARTIYNLEPLFRETVDTCSKLLESQLGLSLTQIIYPSSDKAEQSQKLLQETRFTQPALFVIEYALAQLWQSWGVTPKAYVGHSIGEYVAACLADVFSLETALNLVAARGRLMQNLPSGLMLSVFLSEDEIQSLLQSLSSSLPTSLPTLNENISLAVVNAPTNCVLSGSEEAIIALERSLSEKDIAFRRLHTSHAFHSHMMDPILDEFTNLVKQAEPQKPKTPFLSNLSGTWITDQEAQNPIYWANHLRQTVRFADNVQILAQQAEQVLLEVGPGKTLSALAKRQLNQSTQQAVFTSLPHPKEGDQDYQHLLQTFSQLWLAGVQLNLKQFYAHEKRYRVPLPTYPFQRQRYWVEPGHHQVTFTEDEKVADVVLATSESDSASNVQPTSKTYHAPRNKTEQILAQIWADLIGIERIDIHDNFFDLGGDSLVGIQVVAKAKQADLLFTPGDLLTYQTIADLALHITSTANDDSTAKTPSRFLDKPTLKKNAANLIQLRSGGDNPPLFLIHPANGDARAYRPLVNYLAKDRPVYGFIASGLYDDKPIIKNMRWLTTKYVEAMQIVQPTGPYYLSGWSAGGTIAFSMALRLQKLKESVAFLGLIDAGMGNYQQDVLRLAQGLLQSNTWFSRLYESGKLGQQIFNIGVKGLWKSQPVEVSQRIKRANEIAILMMYLGWFESEQGLTLDVKPEDLIALEQEDQFAYALQKMEAANVELAAEQMASIKRWVTVTLVNSRLIDDYKPGTYNGPVTFFRASEIAPDASPIHADYTDDTLGWSEHCTQPITVHKVPGHHYVLLDEPHVKTLAQKFQQALDEAKEQAKNEVKLKGDQK